MSEYESVYRGPLKLKGDAGMISKKKKKKSKNKDKEKLIEEDAKKEISTENEKKFEVRSTKAELMFQKMQENVQNKRIQKIASMTHKQRVEEFNKHLDNLTEHFDIPKVSWTK